MFSVIHLRSYYLMLSASKGGEDVRLPLISFGVSAISFFFNC